MHLLRSEAGLRSSDATTLMHRDVATVHDVTRFISSGSRHKSRLHQDDEAKALLRAQVPPAAEYQAPAWMRSAAGYLPGQAAARMAAGLTLRELADRTGIPRETLSRLEHLHRRTGLDTLATLSSYLEVRPERLTRPS